MTLVAQNLTCKRGDRLILSGVSFTLNPGDCLILRGPNGIGKSTLLRVLAGLTPPAGGTLQIDADQIAYAGHLDAVKAQMSVADNLQFWAGIYGSGDAGQTAHHFGLDALADRLAHRLSAGQKRRLGLARLHLSGRRIWLLDEPTVSLDTEHVSLFEKAFADHCTAGGIAVISSHLDLNIPGAETLNLGQFRARHQAQSNPFLEDLADAGPL
ncbi:MAG: heme ABC exporter ATP-binding protein CcmA [Rhodobacteraceae bacterium]|nr:heme ABC exporter ATP-binding protein CcmA [Paracoccaceae bacterium]